MSIPISAASIQGKQRKEIIKEIQQRAKEAALYAIKEVIEAGLEAEVEHHLGRKKGGTRCISSHPIRRSGDVDTAAARMPISFSAMDTIEEIWKQDGGIFRHYAFPCWNVSSVSMM